MLSKYCVGKIVIAFLWSFSLIVEGKSDLGTCPTGQHEEHQSGEIKVSTSNQQIDSKNGDNLSKAHFTDFWGYRYNWTAWSLSNRRKLMNFDQEIQKLREKIPAQTEVGYKALKTPISVDRILQRTKITAGLQSIDCESTIPFPLSNCAEDNKDGAATSKFLQLEFPTNQRIFFHDDVVQPLKPLLEEWLGIPLSEEDIAMFGIRFRRGAWMSLFADPYPIHAFGIILQIGQKVDEKWPLTLVDHQNKRKKIFLKPGQMIMFEGSKVLHGRQFPLNGTYYDELVLFFTREGNKTNSDYYD